MSTTLTWTTYKSCFLINDTTIIPQLVIAPTKHQALTTAQLCAILRARTT